MNKEQVTLNQNVQEEIITNELAQEAVPKQVVSEEEKQAKANEKALKKLENDKQVEEQREKIMIQFDGQESKEEYPEGHILNSKTLGKVAQLEAIDPNTGEFNQERYDDYINMQPSLERRSVGENQKVIKEAMEGGKAFDRSLRDAEIIYGEGGMNRYGIDIRSGIVKLLRGSSNTSGNPDYKTKLVQKAKELGIMVDGQ
ncbi:MAG: hypothetical protein WCI93_00855 [bacterium]